ncbi:MAG: D-glycerate dehydrogenase [Verrucomicrobiae bacterium]|nr:D-glycerate dehydrogenase [Verrucomicrobiae bacterium]NNJ86433.1 D-glycerate dehydrogenase [Akkermansiaceae bacterium]
MSEIFLPRVLVTNDVPDDHLEPLLGIAQIIKGPSGGPMMTRDEVMALAPELTAIINQHELNVDRELLAMGSKLKVVANVAIGYNNFDLNALDEFGVWGTNCPGVFAESAADHTFALLLAVARRVVEADRYCRSGQWVKDGFQPGPWDGMLLSGKTMGIVGFGLIGQAVARRAEGFGMKVIFHDVAATGDSRQRPLEALLSESNVVSLHVPLLPGTQHLINAAALTAMPEGAILLNLARGPVVDEAALADALTSGHLLGAAMDVAENEPELHPGLIDHSRVVFSPHVGGGTIESRKQARLICAANVAAILRGEEPPNPVNRPNSKAQGETCS